MAARSADVARALNSLRDFSSEDQQSLVEVIQDYCTFSDGRYYSLPAAKSTARVRSIIGVVTTVEQALANLRARLTCT